jgi:hypothetical protein
MLFVIGAKSAIIGAAAFDRGVEAVGHIPRFNEFLGEFVVLNIVGN